MSASEVPAPLLAVRGLGKRFGAVWALREFDLDIQPGEVHALIGANGSGKSTLIKSLAGFHAPDEGRVMMHGETLSPQRLGMAFLHQDAPVAGAMTVLENVRVGRYPGSLLTRIRPRDERARVRALLRSTGLDVAPDQMAGRLPLAERALIGFAAAAQELPERGGLLVLDEPTACLPPAGVDRLFTAIRGLTAAGSSVLFVSHRLDEVMDIADRISVIRDGRHVGTVNASTTDQPALVRMMLGRDVATAYPDRQAPASEVVLTATSLTGRLVSDVSLRIHRGEILGITGLVGMGQDELPYLIYGALPVRGGTVAVDGRPVRRIHPKELRRAGVALLPADRAAASGALDATVTENLTLPVLNRFFSRGRLSHMREHATARELMRRFDVRPSAPSRRLGQLSGGNQQKVLLAKWLQSQPRVMLLHEPTQGVDISSRAQIFGIIRSAAGEGTGILMASSEYEDLAGVCDRVLVLSRGRVVAELCGSELTEDAIVRSCLLAA